MTVSEGSAKELLPSPRHGLGDLAIDEKLQSSTGLCGVGSAGSTGKSCVTYCPGRHARRISAPGSWAGAAARLPDQARSIAITAPSAPNAGSVIVQRSPPSVHAEARPQRFRNQRTVPARRWSTPSSSASPFPEQRRERISPDWRSCRSLALQLRSATRACREQGPSFGYPVSVARSRLPIPVEPLGIDVDIALALLRAAHPLTGPRSRSLLNGRRTVPTERGGWGCRAGAVLRRRPSSSAAVRTCTPRGWLRAGWHRPPPRG